MNWYVIYDDKNDCVKYLPIPGIPTGSRIPAVEINGMTPHKAARTLQAMYDKVQHFPTSGVFICRKVEVNE